MDITNAYNDFVDEKEPVWHDFPGTLESGGGAPANSYSGDGLWKRNFVEAEQMLRQSTGLTKLDLMLIQTKLVEAATQRAKASETLARSPSTLRRRRPSTAQSIQSFGGPSRVSLRDHT